jgi:hypothetical protein
VGKLPSNREIERLLKLVIDEQSVSIEPGEYDLESGLLRFGCDPEVAGIMADMMPDAFAQIVLREMGGQLINQANFRWADGSVRPAPLSSDPIWKAISRVAETMAGDRSTRPAFARVAKGSAIIDSLNGVYNSGAKADGATSAVAFARPPRRWSFLDRLL